MSKRIFFSISGPEGAVEELKAVLEPLTIDPGKLSKIIEAAKAEGFEFDD